MSAFSLFRLGMAILISGFFFKIPLSYLNPYAAQDYAMGAIIMGSLVILLSGFIGIITVTTKHALQRH